MHTTVETARELKIQQYLEKLDSEIFFEINVAPPPASFNRQGNYRGTFIESDFERIYYIQTPEKRVYAKLEDYLDIPLRSLSHVFTMLATGKDLLSWLNEWLIIHPTHDMNSKVAVYLYRKVAA